jgi:hypothetical protein
MIPRIRLSFNDNVFAYRRTYLAALLVACFILTVQSSHASAQVDRAKTANTTCQPVQLNFDPAIDVHALKAFKLAVAHLLKQGRFDELDCTADQLRSSKARFAGGMWQMQAFYRGLEDPWVGHATEIDWQNHIERLKRWVKVKPQSITARIALAEAYGSYAWDARGTGTSDTVSETGWDLLQERLEKAKKTLDEAATLDAKCPEWYVAMETVARGQNWDLPQATRLIEKAIRFEPEYYSSYGMHATFLLPKWYGEEGDTAKFAKQVADRIGGKAGDILYFQIAMRLVCSCDEPELLNLSWPRIQKGAAETENQYGASLINLNRLALLAVKFKDATVADTAFKRLGDNWEEDTWKTEHFFKNNVSWASTVAATEANERDRKQMAEANLRTPEGVKYLAAVEEMLAPYMQQCAQANPGDLQKFEFVTSVLENGRPTLLWIAQETPVANCLLQKFVQITPNHEKLPPPPRSPYWIKLELDPAKFVVASQ